MTHIRATWFLTCRSWHIPGHHGFFVMRKETDVPFAANMDVHFPIFFASDTRILGLCTTQRSVTYLQGCARRRAWSRSIQKGRRLCGERTSRFGQDVWLNMQRQSMRWVCSTSNRSGWFEKFDHNTQCSISQRAVHYMRNNAQYIISQHAVHHITTMCSTCSMQLISGEEVVLDGLHSE